MLYHFFFLVIFFTFYTLSLSSSPLITKELLDGFFDSFNRHDVDGVLSYMSEDCEFHAIAGDADQKLGKTFSGKLLDIIIINYYYIFFFLFISPHYLYIIDNILF